MLHASFGLSCRKSSFFLNGVQDYQNLRCITCKEVIETKKIKNICIGRFEISLD